MSLLKSFYRSRIPSNSKKLTDLLEKIRLLSAVKASRFNIRIGQKQRFRGERLTSFTIDETLAVGTIELNSGSRFGVTAASLVLQDLTFTAKKIAGWYANDTTITYVDGAALAVAVIDRKITVTLETGVSDADAVKAAVDVNAEAAALVAVAVSGVGATVQVAAAEAPLAGGSSTQVYDKADIRLIKRLRTKKYLIVIDGAADPTA